jgi:hypothetical protein
VVQALGDEVRAGVRDPIHRLPADAVVAGEDGFRGAARSTSSVARSGVRVFFRLVIVSAQGTTRAVRQSGRRKYLIVCVE